MMPAAVFADDSVDLTPGTQVQEPGEPTGDQATSPGGIDREDPATATSPGGIDQDDPGTSPGGIDQDDPGTDLTPAEGDVRTMQLNCMPPTYPTYGSITITKDVTGDRPAADATFNFTLTGPDSFSNSFSIVGEGFYTVPHLAFGEYTITETGVPANYMAKSNGSKITISASDVNKSFTFKNQYSRPTTLTISKTIVGNPGTTATFTFDIDVLKGFYGYFWYEDYKTVSVDGGGSNQINIDPGHYKITEISIPINYRVSGINPQEICIGQKDDAAVTFKNTYTGPTTGAITITKRVANDEGIRVPITEFTFHISGPGEFSKEFKLNNSTNGSITFSGLAPGSYVITEDPISGFTPEGNDPDKEATVRCGSASTVEFTNIYDPDNPQERIIKDVAPYDGEGIPETGFEKSLTLTGLNQSVIYRIRVDGSDVQTLTRRDINLSDIYNRAGTNSDITQSLLYWFDDEFVPPDGFHQGETYYYIDTITEYGTYVNTISLLGSDLVEIASSSAVVVVNRPSGGDNNSGSGGGGGSHSRIYEVTYNPNFPGITSTGGIVPVDGNHYSYNNTVNVKGNTGDLKAENYVFKGWNTKPDGTGVMYQTGGAFNITGDTVLYAIWEVAGTETVQQTTANTEPQPPETDTVQSNALDNVPKTGDSTPLLLMLLLSILSIASIEMFGRRKIRNNAEK
jgi:hypothetical protein